MQKKAKNKIMNGEENEEEKTATKSYVYTKDKITIQAVSREEADKQYAKLLDEKGEE